MKITATVTEPPKLTDAEMISDAINELALAISCHTGTGDSNFVEAIDNLAQNVKRIATAITPAAAAGQDASGGHVESLTEAVMGINAGLVKVAEAISELADAVSLRS